MRRGDIITVSAAGDYGKPRPTASNGFRAVSQIMADKILAYPRVKSGPVTGRLSATEISALNNLLSVMIGLAD